jgi:hypothetical protein
VPDYIAHEWAFIPHFYLNFYVFQYATSFTASEALASKVLAGDPARTKRYLTFLSAAARNTHRPAQGRGVDMTTRRAAAAHAEEDERGDGRNERILAGSKYRGGVGTPFAVLGTLSGRGPHFPQEFEAAPAGSRGIPWVRRDCP